MEGNFSKLEYLKALKEMKQGKSCGKYSLAPEFYQTFGMKSLLAGFNNGFAMGDLSTTQRRGIIKLIPKKSEELFYIRNWRPLTLYLPKLVNNNQAGFIKGRCISENIHLIDSVINYTASKKHRRSLTLP